MKPWITLATEPTRDGALELRQRDDDFIITLAGRVVMNSKTSGSEKELPRLALATLAELPTPRVLLVGLGMARTLRAALDMLPPRASITVVEQTPAFVTWGKGPLAPVSRSALADPRVRVVMGDASRQIANAAAGSFDAIIIDLQEGPTAETERGNDPLYGHHALVATMRALAPKGVFAIWAEDHDPAFFKRFGHVFEAQKTMIGQGGRRNVVYVGQPLKETRPKTPRPPIAARDRFLTRPTTTSGTSTKRRR